MTTPSSSIFKNGYEKVPCGSASPSEISEAIRTGRIGKIDFSGQISAIRKASNKTAADKLKVKLPAFAASVSCATREKAATPEEKQFVHTGRLQCDFDGKDHPDWNMIEKYLELTEDPHVEQAFVTASGKGIKAIIRIPADLERHRDAHQAATNYFASLYGLKMDQSTKDPGRLCFFSHDPDAFFSTKAEELDVEKWLPIPSKMEAAPTSSIRGEISHEEIAEILKHIPTRPDYDTWLRIASAVWSVLPMAEGAMLLHQWSPEEKDGEYARKHKERLQHITVGTLIHIAKGHGFDARAAFGKSSWYGRVIVGASDTDSDEIPNDVFPVPSGEVGYIPSGDRIFPIVAQERKWFLRGTIVNEVVATQDGFALAPLSVERAISGLEHIATMTGHRIARREVSKKGEEERIIWRTAPMPANHMEILIQSDKAREHIPRIRQLVACPVIVPKGEREAVLLEQGYHDHAGGTFVTGNVLVPVVPLRDAVASLIEIHADTAFCSSADMGRAVAFSISPAMRSGGWINDDFPLHVAEATETQSGKDYAQKKDCAIYGETSSGIAPSKGGVGSVDESLSRALIAGRPFVCLSNFRGKLESAILESAIRGQGRVDCRALRTAATVDCSSFNWQLSTNGAEFTRDLANRSVVTRLRKQPPGYAFKQYPEGDVLAHVRANQGYYLGCVHAVIREWASRGRPVTAESRHDFRGWCRAMDWIVQHLFDAPPLLEGHQEQQARVANPDLQWLRDIAVAVMVAGRDGLSLSAVDLVEVCEDADIELPGNPSSSNPPMFRIGRTMKKIFAKSESITADSITVTRHSETEYDDNSRPRERHCYTFFP